MLNIEGFSYSGLANIYLQGEEALEPVNLSSLPAEYYIAHPDSGIRISDFRLSVTQMAVNAIESNTDDGSFAEAFCQPAWIQITSENDGTQIEIRDFDKDVQVNTVTLWMGVIHNNRMASVKTMWELLKPVSEQGDIAFAALIP